MAGGKSSRMGEDKAFLKVGGERVIDRTLHIFRDFFNEIILVTNSPLDFMDLDVTIVTDMMFGKGVPGGLYTGLFYSSSRHAFIAPCDMPFLNRSFIKYMLEVTDDYDIVVPETTPGLQPLHAVYSRKCLPHIKALMDTGEFRVNRFYHKGRMLTISEDIILSFDPNLRMFVNINSPEDLSLIS